MRKAKWAFWSILAILIGSMVAGFFIPLGTTGVMIALGLIVAALLLIVLLPSEPRVRTQALAAAPLTALPFDNFFNVAGTTSSQRSTSFSFTRSIG